LGSRDRLLRVIARRLALSVPLLLIVTTSTFVLVALIPGDAARTIVGGNGTEAQYEALRHALGLDESLPARFGQWLERAAHGDLGTSLFGGEPVASALNSRLGVTLSLVGGSTLLAALLGIAFGVAAAVRPGPLGRALDALSLVGLAVPSFFLGLLLISWFAVSLRLFPATGYVPPSQSPSGWLQSLVLPVITLALPGVAVIAKQTRDAMREALERPFVQTLRATGISRRSIVLRHALRSAAISIVTVVGLVFVGALSGAVVVESVFALPGLGSLAVQATTQRDLPMIQGVALYFTVIVIAVNLVVDLLYGWLDPRVEVA
jgi:peptide/nickel transport system permease protein